MDSGEERRCKIERRIQRIQKSHFLAIMMGNSEKRRVMRGSDHRIVVRLYSFAVPDITAFQHNFRVLYDNSEIKLALACAMILLMVSITPVKSLP